MVPFLRMLALAFGLLMSSTAVLADTVADWNDVAMDVVVRSGQHPGQALRAVAAAAHHVLVELYPNKKAALDAALQTSLDSIQDASSKTSGVVLGNSIGAIIFATRVSDSFAALDAYKPVTVRGANAPATLPTTASRLKAGAPAARIGFAVSLSGTASPKKRLGIAVR